jgi:hypothetical protein
MLMRRSVYLDALDARQLRRLVAGVDARPASVRAAGDASRTQPLAIVGPGRGVAIAQVERVRDVGRREDVVYGLSAVRRCGDLCQ